MGLPLTLHRGSNSSVTWDYRSPSTGIRILSSHETTAPLYRGSNSFFTWLLTSPSQGFAFLLHVGLPLPLHRGSHSSSTAPPPQGFAFLLHMGLPLHLHRGSHSSFTWDYRSPFTRVRIPPSHRTTAPQGSGDSPPPIHRDF